MDVTHAVAWSLGVVLVLVIVIGPEVYQRRKERRHA